MEATPDRGFMLKLKELDPKLGCKFNSEMERFVITYERAVGPAANIMVVQGPRGFRQPDQRDIVTLQQGDLCREDMSTKLARAAKYMENYKAKQDRDRKDNIRDMTKDDRRQLGAAFGRLYGASKCNSTFRRVNLRQKGKVF